MRQGKLRGALLATSSALALVVAIDQSAEAASCAIVTDPTLPFSYSTNTCVVIDAAGSNATAGSNVTHSSGTVNATGTSSPTDIAISLTAGASINGSITNQGTINANYNGIGLNSATVTGSITNAAGAAIHMTATGIGISVGNSSTVGSITNNGTITATAMNSSVAIDVSASTVNGNVINGPNGTIIADATGAVQVVNGGAVNGSVENFGSITAIDTNATNPGVPPGSPNVGSGIYVYSSNGTAQTITGSIVNEVGGTIAGGYGIQVFATNSTNSVIIQGSVVNAGTIGTKATPAAQTGIVIGSATVNGAVSNSGTIVAAANGILLVNLGVATAQSAHSYPTNTFTFTGGPATIKGGVTNSGSITSTGTGYAGIALAGANVTGGITNTTTGTITATNGVGILLSNTGRFLFSNATVFSINAGPSTVTGGITNQGTITAKTGIMVTGGSTVDFITNTGTITGTGGTAIDVRNEGAATVINQQGGTITGNILLSALGDTVNVTGGSIAGNIVGQGSSSTLNFSLGSGTFTYTNSFTTINQVNFNSGTVTLEGADTATNVAINGGTVVVGNNLAFGTAGVTMAAGTTLSFLNTGNFTVANNIAISGDPFFTPPAGTTQTLSGIISNGTAPGVVDMTGAGTLVLSGNNTYSGGTVISAGTLQLGNGGTSGSIVGNVTDNGTFAIDRSNALTFGGVISGSGVFQQNGTGTTTLTGANTYTGATTINAGTLALSGIGSIASSSGVNVANAGATFDISGTTSGATVTTLSGVAGSSVKLGGQTLTLSNASSTFGGNISGTGGLTLTTGSETLSGTNAYTGATTINGGTLALSGTGSVASSSGVADNGTFDISKLTNGGTTITTLTGAGAVALGANTLTLSNASSTFSGSIGGIGGLTLTAGTETLSGANAYTGATTINGGTLALSGTGSIATSSGVNVANAGAAFDISGTTSGATVTTLSGAAGSSVNLGGQTLTLSNASSTFGGTIGGTGGFSITGGTETLSGTSTYTGATSVSAGAGLTIASGGSLGTGTGAETSLLTNSGTVTVNAGGTLWAANVTNSAGGTLINNGTVNDTLTNAGTVTNAGTYNANVINTGTVTNNLAWNGNLLSNTGTVTNSSGATWTGNATNSAGGTLTNAGTWTGGITNAGTFNNNAGGTVSGGLTNTAGTTTNNGTINGGATVSGGALAGTGTVTGGLTVNSGGTLAPGAAGSPGTMTVAGNLAFQPGAFYLVQVNMATASNTQLTTGGTATLAGTVEAVFTSGTFMSRNYTILHSAGLGGTTFNSLVTVNAPKGFTESLAYTSTDVVLDLTATLGALATGGLNRNQQQVAGALNNFFNSGGALPPNFLALFGLTGANLQNTLTQLSGEAATGSRQAAFQLMTEFLGVMTDPFVDRRGAAGGANSVTGFAAEDQPLPPEIASAYAAVFKAPIAKAPPFEQRWSVWGSAFGGGNHTDGDPNGIGSHDLSARTAGFAAGADYRVSPFTIVGFSLAGGGTNWNLAQGLGGGRSDAFLAGVYGKTSSGPAYVAASFAIADHWMSTTRTSAAFDQLTANFNAQSYGGRVETGYRVGSPVAAVTPYGAIQSQAFVTPTYSELDASGGGFGLTYAGRSATDTRGEAGARFDHVAALDPTTLLLLRAKLGYAHDWVSDPSLAAVFEGLPGASFIVNGATPAHDSGLTSASAELRFANGIALGAKFDGEFAERSQTYAGTGTVRYTW